MLLLGLCTGANVVNNGKSMGVIKGPMFELR